MHLREEQTPDINAIYGSLREPNNVVTYFKTMIGRMSVGPSSLLKFNYRINESKIDSSATKAINQSNGDTSNTSQMM